MSEVDYSADVQTIQRILIPAEAWSLRVKREDGRIRKHTTRARKRGLEATLTVEEWLGILERHGWGCAFCGGPFESIEHVVPLHYGGGTTAGNCVPACLECNELRDWVFRGIAGVEKARRLDRMEVVGDLIGMGKMGNW